MAKTKKAKTLMEVFDEEGEFKDSRIMGQEKMLIFLHRLQGKLCAYANPYKVGGTSFCDCKYDKDNGENIGSFGEAGNGCPEVRQAIAIVSAMTPAEYKKVLERAVKGGNERIAKIVKETYEAAKVPMSKEELEKKIMEGSMKFGKGM